MGSHSIRKGAATYCSSGTTASPASAAVHLRAGWTLGGVQDTYLRYDSAGDMHVGRTVCGLPVNKTNFAMLPPHFVEVNDLIENTLSQAFPSYPANLKYVLEHCLASLVYHEEYLRQTLHPNHILLNSYLFRSNTAMNQLKEFVVCGLPEEGGAMNLMFFLKHSPLKKRPTDYKLWLVSFNSFFQKIQHFLKNHPLQLLQTCSLKPHSYSLPLIYLVSTAMLS